MVLWTKRKSANIYEAISDSLIVQSDHYSQSYSVMTKQKINRTLFGPTGMHSIKEGAYVFPRAYDLKSSMYVAINYEILQRMFRTINAHTTHLRSVRESTCIHHFALDSFTETQLRMVQIKAYLCTVFEYPSLSTDGWEANSLLLSSGLLHCKVCLNLETRG